MREIVFRGKSRDDGKWYEGDLGTVAHKRFIDDGKNNERVIPETVGQFTGLTDKNGKKIFEGDLCKFNEPFGKSGITIFVVEWDNDNARFLGFTIGGIGRYMVYVGREPKVEVIGNIHDNPDLMMQEEA